MNRKKALVSFLIVAMLLCSYIYKRGKTYQDTIAADFEG